MSEVEKKHDEASASSEAKPKGSRFWRIVRWGAGTLLLLLILIVITGAWYTTTDDFQRRVGAEVVKVLEDSTGGRVELGHIRFNLWHLAIEADNLVIHGTEAPGEAPYLAISKILLRVRINTFLSHTTGKGSQSHIGLNYLRIEQPHVHLIIDKNGNTNQPVPKHPSTSNEPVQDTLLDLQATTVEIADGLALLNDRAISFDLAANKLNASIQYIKSSDRYGMDIDLADLRTRLDKQPEVQSRLHVNAELGRDLVKLNKLDYQTGAKTHLLADGLVRNFAKPFWQTSVTGSVELRQLGYLANLDGFSSGTVDLNLKGHSCNVTPQEAQTKPHFWQRRHKAPPAAKVLPPDPTCQAGYLLVGNVKASHVNYYVEHANVRDVDAAAQLRVTPDELLFTALTSTLPGGGRIAGELKIENWLGEVPTDSPVASATTVATEKVANNTAKAIGAKAPVAKVKKVKPAAVPQTAVSTVPPVNRAHAYLTVKVQGISLRTIMDITAPAHYGDLGIDTSIAGPVEVEWGGPVTNVSDSVKVDADLDFTPTHVTRRNALNVPLSGHVKGHYDGTNETVSIANVTLNTPGTTLVASGMLGVNRGDPLTRLQVNLQARDLGEFDSVLQTLGFEENGKRGSAAIPVVLHGQLAFNGYASGAVRNLDVKGHLAADNLEVKLGTAADVHIDSAVGDAEYSPSSGVAVAASTIKRGSALLNVEGSFKPRRFVTRSGAVDYAWDSGMAIDATAKLADAQAADLLQIAGQQNKVPLTGTVNLNAHVAGTVKNLNGNGNITLKNGTAYGENYQVVSVDLNAQGQQINATKLLVQAHNMSVNGQGSYNIATKHIVASATGNNIVLSKIDNVAKLNANADGVLSFSFNANGTLEEPNLHANLKLANINVQGKQLGDLTATANSTGSTVNYQLNASLVGAQLTGSGQTSLLGDYQTKATVQLAHLDAANLVAMFSPGTIKASSSIGGTITVSGPAANPKQLAGTAEFNNFDLQLQGVELKTAEPLRASLRNGIVTLDQLHITGNDTDIRAGGTVVVFGDANPKGGPINIRSSGSVNMALAHTFDPDLITSGKVTFNITADGRLKDPAMTGNVKLENVNVAVDGIPNGLSSMNGTLVFNENRLDVQSLTARTGGGELKIGGSLIYQKGLFADLTATGDAVRVRLYGLSATANASFRLQGGPQSLLLSGNVLVTRFGVGPDVDFAAFAGAGGVQLPPDPNSAANKIQLDVHVTSSPQLDFQNSYAKLAGTVDLTVRGTAAVPSILGRITITDGSATFAGTKYQLERGNIYFSNPVRIDPVIDIDASARVENYDITIGLNGTATNLKPTYRSEPPLTEADIFNLLALGRTQEEAQLYREQQVQAGTDPTTSALLGGALNATVSSRVGKLFGAGSVKIDPAFVGTLGGSTARITVQEPLSKQLTLTFATNVNETAEQLIQVQYQITDNTAIVATRDESGVFSIVYKIRKRYR